MKWKWRRSQAHTARAEQVALLRQELQHDWSTEALSEEKVFYQKLLRDIFTSPDEPRPSWTRVFRRGWSRARAAWKALSTREQDSMRNLAERLDCDWVVQRELERAQIEVIHLDRAVGEVPSRVRGRIGPVEIARAPKCYIAEGPVPIEAARYLYADPIGRRDALIHGMCDRPPPSAPWVAWYTADGARVYPRAQETAYRETQARWPEAFADVPPLVFHDLPEQLGALGFIDYYHLVSEDGLQAFATALRRHSVDQRTLPWWWEQHRRMTARANPFTTEVDTQEMEQKPR